MKLLKDQRGIGHVVEIVIIAVIVLGIGGFIAWRILGGQSQNSGNNSAKSALEQAIANANCTYEDKDLCKFITAGKVGKDVKAEWVQTVDGKASNSTFISTNNGNNTHIIMSIDGKPFESITIGTTRYTKASNGTWWKQTVEKTEVDKSNSTYDPSFQEPTSNDEPNKPSYKKLGTEPCGSLTCFKYQITNSEPELKDTTQYIWFDNKDYLLRRMTIKNATSSYDQAYSYEDFTINEPSPTKDLQEGYYLLPGSDEPIKVPTASDLMGE